MAFELNSCMSAYVMLQYLIPIMSQINMRVVIQKRSPKLLQNELIWELYDYID